MSAIPDPEDFDEWLSNPCTVVFREGVREALLEAQQSPRISATVDQTVLENARVAGYIDALEELDTIISELRGQEDD